MRAAIVVAVWLASTLPHALAQSPVTTAAPALQDLRGVAQLRSMFDSDRDKIRIVLLLSPT
jgi:hypothetical protein